MALRRMALLGAVTALLLSSVAVGGVAALSAPLGPASVPAHTAAAGAHAVPTFANAAPVASTSIDVGPSPVGILIAPSNNTAFVESELGNNLSALSLSPPGLSSVIPVGTEPYPQAMALDPTNLTVYVANSGSGNVSVVSIAGANVLHSVTVGSSPDAVLFNPYNRDVYVANGGSASVSIISPVGAVPVVIATVPVGPEPGAMAVDTATHDVFVADSGSNNVTVISGKTNSVVATVQVGLEPGPYGAMLYDPATKDVYVANAGSGNVSVIGGKNLTDFASLSSGLTPDALALDASTGELFVANRFSDNVSVFLAKDGAHVGSVPVGNQPGLQGAIAVAAKEGLVFVPNSASGNVSVISAASLRVVSSVPVGLEPVAVAVDPADGSAWVVNEGSSNVTVFQVSLVTFLESGLPKGDSWSVALGSPPVSLSTTVGRGKSAVAFFVRPGRLSYAVTLPSGYALSRVTGPNGPTQKTIVVSGASATFKLSVGSLESLTFSETTLPAGSTWAIEISSAYATGGPASQNLSTTGTSMTFLDVVAGPWHYTLTKVPSPYVPLVSHGSVHVGTHAVTKTLGFKEVAATVLFEEAGLPSGTFWEVNLTGTVTTVRGSTNSTIVFDLPSGSYTYTVYNYSAYNPRPETGTFSVVAPHNRPYVIAVSYISV